ncbi:hypothetical protein T4B_12163 [Trichinella pseudospiralis]|uniref:Uncharacterized protein n=1 Tax=Trichinella pseudospiralis TaxID=6337 RepID=A0A0V1ICX2_TRIPS|nr:hypothetical protein T4B_12163 [Trichinella pseudospiralis]
MHLRKVQQLHTMIYDAVMIKHLHRILHPDISQISIKAELIKKELLEVRLVIIKDLQRQQTNPGVNDDD